MDISAAIDFLIDSSDEAITQIDSQIETLEAKLQRLRRARSVLAKARGEHKVARRQVKSSINNKQLAYWDELEQKIYDAVSQSADKLTCKDVGDLLKLNHTSIGRAINKSQRLEKDGSYIVVLP